MSNYRTMTPEQSANAFSILLGRPVRYSRNIYADREVTERHLEAYSRRSVAARISDDGSIVLYGKPEHNGYFNLLKTAVYQLMVEKGPDGLLPDVNAKRMVARMSVPFTGVMSETDLQAFCMSCSDGNVSGLKTAADILRVAFKGAPYPEGLEHSVCNGLKAYRYGILEKVREGTDRALILKFAMETASPYSGHRHLHLGKPDFAGHGKNAYRDLSYADINMICDIDEVRGMARDAGMDVGDFLEKHLDDLRSPVCVLKDVKKKDNHVAVFNIRSKDGSFVCLSIPSAKKAEDIRQNIIDSHRDKNIDGYIKLNASHYFLMSPEKLCKILSFSDYKTGETNILHVRRTGGIAHTDIIDILGGTKVKEAPENRRPMGRTEGVSGTSIPTLLPSILNVAAKVVNNFKNPKNFSDLEKEISESIKITENAQRGEEENIPAETVSDDAPALKSGVLKNLSRPVAEGGFSKATLKKFADKGIVNAGDLRSRLSLNNGEERFVADFGQKAYRDAMRWMDSLEVSSLRVVARQKVSQESTGQQGASLAALDFFRALREFPKDTLPGQVVMPVATDGRLFTGADSYQLSARLAANMRWNGCNVFLTQEDMTSFGLSPLQAAEPVHLVAGDGRQVWNLMDLDMGGDMKEALSRRYREMTPAIPAPMIRQLATYTPSSRDEVPSIAAHLSSRFDVMSGDVARTTVSSLETAVKDEVSSLEKRYDPMGVLREYMFSPADIHRLYFMGEAHVNAEVAKRPVMEYDKASAVGKQKVDVTLKLENNGIAAYAHDGTRIPGKLKDLLKNEDRRLKPTTQKASLHNDNLDLKTVKKQK